LETGDVLSRDEFERRYHAMPNVKAELIEGVAYVSSPVRHDWHARPHLHLSGWLATYMWDTPGTDGGDNGTLRLDLQNEPQPDLMLFVEPECGGQVKLVGGYVQGAPDLVLEVAASSVSIDLNAKLRSYHRNQVQEYLVWRVNDQAVDWFRLEGSDFVRMQPDTQGVLRSKCFPGLWLNAPALVRLDMQPVVASLRAGLADPSHQAFVAELAARRKS
jgi:Uma2 family endonuclease